MSITTTMSDPRILLRQCIFHLLCTLMVSASAQLEIMNQWSFLKFNAPFNYPVGNYLPENTVFTGLEVGWDRVFLSTPRLWPGNPATVSWIPRNSFENSGEMSPPLQVCKSKTNSITGRFKIYFVSILELDIPTIKAEGLKTHKGILKLCYHSCNSLVRKIRIFIFYGSWFITAACDNDHSSFDRVFQFEAHGFFATRYPILT